MGLNAAKKKSSGAKDFVEQEVIDEGMYPCRVVQVIELGMQPQRPHKGKEKPPVDMLYITYELTDTFLVDENGDEIEDKPRWQSEDFPYYNLECTTAKCNKRLKAIDPKNKTGGDWAKIGGAPCNVTFIHNVKGDKTYVNVASVGVVRAKDAKDFAKLVNPIKIFDLDEPDMEIFEALPAWLQAKIKGNLNFKGSVLDVALNGEDAGVPDEPEEQEDEKETVKEKAPAKKRGKAKEEEEPEPEVDEEEDGDEIPW